MTSLGVEDNKRLKTTQRLNPGNSHVIPQQQHMPSSEVPAYLQIFRKGEPLTLGVVQMIIGITCVVLGSLLVAVHMDFTSITSQTKAPTWTGTLLLIFGSISASAQKGPLWQVTGCLVGNVFCALTSAGGIIVFSLDLFITNHENCLYPEFYCTLYHDAFTLLQKGILGYLLTLSTLALCISISLVVFASKSVCGKSSPSETVQPLVMVQTTYAQDMEVPSMQDPGMQIVQGMPVSCDASAGQGLQMTYGSPQAYGLLHGQGHATPTPHPMYYDGTPAVWKQ